MTAQPPARPLPPVTVQTVTKLAVFAPPHYFRNGRGTDPDTFVLRRVGQAKLVRRVR